MRKKYFFTYDFEESFSLHLRFCAVSLLVRAFLQIRLPSLLKSAVSMVVVPVQKGMNNIGFWVYDKYQTLQEISVVLDENKKLQSQVDDLTEENNQLKQDSYELNRLRDLYELDQQYAGYSKVGARVIEVTTDNWHSYIQD